jgi:hypothetical protein
LRTKRPASSASAKDGAASKPIANSGAARSEAFGRKSAIERISGLSHVDQQRRRAIAIAVFPLVSPALGQEGLTSHGINIGQRTSGERGKAETENGTDIRLANVGQNTFLQATGGLKRLNQQQTLLEFIKRKGGSILGR